MTFDDDFTITIAGARIVTPDQVAVINPATGKAFASAPAADAALLDRAVDAAQTAFPQWRDTPIVERRRALLALADAIEANAAGFGALFTREQGRPLALATREILSGATWLRAVVAQDVPVEVVEDSATRRVEVHHVPFGVVAAIVPWNFPFLLTIWKIAPALLTGNTVVLKPSPYTPLCALKLGELARDILPAGVFNVLSGDDALGPLISSHSGFAKISFTGSTATGKKVMEAASRDLKRITLELGGNDAAIVLPDADPDTVADAMFAGAFFNSAQVCIATKRLYVHADIYDAVRDRLHARLLAAVVGDGETPGVTHGPVQNLAQYRRVTALIADAEANGLTLLRGSSVSQGEGYFIPLTLVDNPPEDAAVVCEEAFGPVLPMMRFSDIDDVIDQANCSEYGLAGSVWSEDIDAAVAIAKRMDTGSIWINQNRQVAPHVPFSGFKQSGIGVENGRAGLLEFTQSKSIYIPK
ncbi:aldehyde dehydrogenase family protein [Sphingobium sp. CR2-8]|uniref:aldehyde dehydrogenase family protein n=1 Tax=Sphingobium sp. CR2-8 TaxID=1306534 RepID=UPI002DB907F1|nr:aldehyde dehydrogenase family protein [Sphingobium sp. CR2-8]MEC3909524.1 aldehyde dehydrogenase family protein [Sphingobium sp. CR2-8]